MRVQSCNVRRCDTKAFMKAICDDNNISLDGQFGALPYLLKSGVPASRARVLRAGDRVCTVA